MTMPIPYRKIALVLLCIAVLGGMFAAGFYVGGGKLISLPEIGTEPVPPKKPDAPPTQEDIEGTAEPEYVYVYPQPETIIVREECVPVPQELWVKPPKAETGLDSLRVSAETDPSYGFHLVHPDGGISLTRDWIKAVRFDPNKQEWLAAHYEREPQWSIWLEGQLLWAPTQQSLWLGPVVRHRNYAIGVGPAFLGSPSGASVGVGGRFSYRILAY